ncbi:hypothetical protein LEP1GSC108_0846 [Leptospira weilii str. UI 13098]|uniref:Uncharacterized protein n=1 Tax=Leptospira weilii str. UI 13098 TaxID=1088542 RepID=M6PX86_9LEPT|nr:hypothetical protein LEP1GSC108_0846 [Leptospira weilii str. UI 13098]
MKFGRFFAEKKFLIQCGKGLSYNQSKFGCGIYHLNLTEVNFFFHPVFREFRVRLKTFFQKGRLSEQVKENVGRKRDLIFENVLKMRIAESLCRR